MRSVRIADAIACAFVAGVLGATRIVAQAPPSTDIYLAPITLTDRDSNRIAIGTPIDITHRPGYDNQPAFMADERAVFYTSTREDGQADIYRYDIASRRTTRVTATPESEYSPTFMPGTNRFSAIRVERDSTQRLWSFAMDGSDPRLVLRTIKPVGYHAWLDPSHVALFVLGAPATLQVAELGSERVDTIARGIGRSLSVVAPGRVSFVTRAANGFMLNTLALDRVTGKPDVRVGLAAIEPGGEYVIWTPRGDALTASGSKLYMLRAGPADSHWAEVADLAAEGITHISRLAISPNGHWLAMVADDDR